ncbi:hypothetical protein U5640_02140 [Streptomyces sp. SS7]|uniref:hypothetical protein n=1 Tax=Streptomyces sp. SS7 TaxID=3108485 RepID=UPI0030EF358D
MNTGSCSTSRTVTWTTSLAAFPQEVPFSPTYAKKSTNSSVSPVCRSMRSWRVTRSTVCTLPMSAPTTSSVRYSTAPSTAPRLLLPRWSRGRKASGGSGRRTRPGNHSTVRSSGRGVLTRAAASVRILTLYRCEARRRSEKAPSASGRA